MEILTRTTNLLYELKQQYLDSGQYEIALMFTENKTELVNLDYYFDKESFEYKIGIVGIRYMDSLENITRNFHENKIYVLLDTCYFAHNTEENKHTLTQNYLAIIVSNREPDVCSSLDLGRGVLLDDIEVDLKSQTGFSLCVERVVSLTNLRKLVSKFSKLKKLCLCLGFGEYIQSNGVNDMTHLVNSTDLIYVNLIIHRSDIKQGGFMCEYFIGRLMTQHKNITLTIKYTDNPTRLNYKYHLVRVIIELMYITENEEYSSESERYKKFTAILNRLCPNEKNVAKREYLGIMTGLGYELMRG